ncbi:MAG: UDP-glucose--hexose-1-phosphate uridylyltransferase, partial [Acholeplasmataceae bacterium]
DVQHIKKENIGLIEAMGLAILPGRLESELRMILRALRNRERNLSAQLARHAHWYEGLRVRRTTWTLEDLLDEVGKKFVSVLEDAGVFKFDQGGISAMHRLIETVLY